MTIVTTGAGITTDVAHEGPSLMFELVDLLRTSTNWTVDGSGNGTSGGMGSDYITTAADLENSGAWVCMGCPGSGPQILFSRYTATDTQWRVAVAPDADYTGGGASTIPTATSEALFFQTTMVGTSSTRLHITAEDGSTVATAGWSLYAHAEGTPGTAKAGLAFCPTVYSFAEDTDPWILYIGSYTGGHDQGSWNETTTSTTQGGARGIATDSSMQTVPAALLQHETVIAAPNNSPSSPTSQDLALPMMHIRAPSLGTGCWKGANTFAYWNGTTRAPLETYASKTRVSFGDVNFPWDGTSTPAAS